MSIIITTTIMNTATTITDLDISAGREIGDTDFDGTTGGMHGPMLLLFVSENCPVCLRLLAQLTRLMANEEKQLMLAKVLFSESSALAEHFGVWSAPALLMVQNGDCSWQFVGEPSRRELEDLLARARRTTLTA